MLIYETILKDNTGTPGRAGTWVTAEGAAARGSSLQQFSCASPWPQPATAHLWAQHRENKGVQKKPREGCHLAEVGFGWPKWDPLEPGLDPDHRHRVKVEWCLASPLWSRTEWKGKHTPRSNGSKQTCPRATLSELLINTRTDITRPGLGLDDMVKERKQNLNHAPRACSDRYPCYSSLISKTWSPEQTTNLSQFTNQLQLKHWFTKLQPDPKSGRES